MSKLVWGFFLLAISFGSHASAQTTVGEPVVPETSSALDRWSFGLEGGWDENTPVITMPDYASDMKYLKSSGYSFGLSAKYRILNWLYGRAEVLWLQKNYNMNRTALGNSGSLLNASYVNNYLSVPVTAMVSFGYNFRVFAYAGGYVGYWMSGSRSGNTFSMNYLLYGDLSSTEYDEPWEFDENRDNRFDAGLVYGLGVSLLVAKHFDISVEGRYYYGLTDVQKDYMSFRTPHYNTTLSIQAGVAYKF
ncbi:MAG: PorT family protein [Bacteroidales bacterium]|nr:PorT family protein [Bacteroidales bacterium]